MQLKRLVWGWLLVFWSAAAYAAQTTFAKDLTTIAPADIALSLVLAMVGGAAYCAQKVADPAVALKSVPAEITKDVLTSILVGLLFFLGGTKMEWDSLTKAIFITLGGYGGSRVLEPALSALINLVSKLGNKAQ